MNLLNKLTLKNLKLNKKRTIVTIIGIMLSVALIMTVASIYASGINSLINFEIEEKGNFHVAYYNVPRSDLDKFTNNRKIDAYYLTENIGYAKINSSNEFKPYAFVTSFTKEALDNLALTLVEGRLPEKSDEIVIPTHLKTNGNIDYQIGDVISLDVGTRINKDNENLTQQDQFAYLNEEKIINTQKKEYKIVGIIERPSNNIEAYSAPGYTFITYSSNINSSNVNIYTKYTKDGTKNFVKVTAGILGLSDDLYQKVYDNGNLTNNELIAYQKAKYTHSTNSYLIKLETNPIMESGISNLGIVVVIVIFIIVFTSIYCIKNSFDISITEKIRQYGMLRSIGATKKQIKKNVFYEAMILGLIGIPLGLLVGILASFILIIVSNFYLKDMLASNIKLIFSLSYAALIASVILGIITIFASAFKSARRASKIVLIDSIRNSGNIKITAKSVKSPKIIQKIFGIGGEISYKNLKRNKKKYRTTVVSIATSVFIFIALSSFMNMAFKAVYNEFNLLEYNLLLTSNNINDTNYSKFVDTTKLDGIVDYAIIQSANFRTQNVKYNPEYLSWYNMSEPDDNINYSNFYVVGDKEYKNFLNTLGLDYNEFKDKAILNDYIKATRVKAKTNKNESRIMRLYDCNEGSILSGTLDNGNVVNIPIGYVTDQNPFGLKNIQDQKLIISNELFSKIASSPHIEIAFNAKDATKLQEQIDSFLQDENYQIDNLEENARLITNLFTLVGIFLYGFIIVITLIGITNIFNTITTNMELRRKDFAMLKSIGMTKKEFNKMIRLESLFMGMKALIFGIPMGLGMSYLIHYFLEKDEGIAYTWPIMPILLSTLAVFLLITLIMKYSLNKINKQNTIETIRNENI